MRICVLNSFVLPALVVILLVACRPVKKMNINYLNDKRDSSSTRIWQSYEAKIQPGDRLSVFISAENPASAQIYAVGPNGNAGAVTVDEKGNILFPQLGIINAAGLTRNELRNVLINKLSVYLKDPIVNIDFINFKVTVLGAVAKQGTIVNPEGRITILEALGQSGDITLDGERDSILVIREMNGRREFGHVNLLSNSVFQSPYFVLQQNDVVYVPLKQSKAMVAVKERKGFEWSTVYTVLGALSTLVILISQLSRL
jgi:polysaccharide export outer membrane protein